jgi:hypothetical protein
MLIALFWSALFCFVFCYPQVLLASEPEMGLETVDETGENLMHGAIEQENLDIAQFLIDAGCDFDGDGDLRSPLMDSVQYGKEAMVRLLIRNGTI